MMVQKGYFCGLAFNTTAWLAVLKMLNGFDFL
jgi:hypothetical protein